VQSAEGPERKNVINNKEVPEAAIRPGRDSNGEGSSRKLVSKPNEDNGSSRMKSTYFGSRLQSGEGSAAGRSQGNSRGGEASAVAFMEKKVLENEGEALH